MAKGKYWLSTYTNPPSTHSVFSPCINYSFTTIWHTITFLHKMLINKTQSYFQQYLQSITLTQTFWKPKYNHLHKILFTKLSHSHVLNNIYRIILSHTESSLKKKLKSFTQCLKVSISIFKNQVQTFPSHQHKISPLSHQVLIQISQSIKQFPGPKKK